jgi:cation diffusion facilitator family transporter
MPRSRLFRFAWLSIFAAVVTIGLKLAAFLLTGSVGLLSDALESVVNLVAAIIALIALNIAARPPDDDHAFGHDKVEYFSSGVEGTLILLAAASIAYASIERFLSPQPLDDIGVGLVISAVASLVNGGVAIVLMRAGREYQSITLEADAKHLLTDVYTSIGIIAALIVVNATGWTWLDPTIGIVVALNILRSGALLVRRSALGLMDTAIPPVDINQIESIFDRYRHRGLDFHALRTRDAGARQFISFHVLVPAGWTVQRGHNLLEKLEADVRAALPRSHITTHLEPLGDPAAMADIELDRDTELDSDL